MKMAKAPKEHIDRLRNWMQFNDELCKINPSEKRQWDKFKEDWEEHEEFAKIITLCENASGYFEWEYYMDYYQNHISHIHMRVIFGYQVLLDNVCDPEADTLEYKKEIKQYLPTENEFEKKFVLIKNRLGSIFWTTDDGANYEAEGFIVLHRGNTVNEMINKWSEYYYQLK